MCSVTARAALHRAPVPPVWWPALLVWGLLVGLVGMHGLAPGGTAHPSGHHAAMAADVRAHPDAESVCHGDGGGHAQHADATCASGAVGAGPAPLPPTADPIGHSAVASDARRGVTGDGRGGRAPPSLAELQLLRI
jgi:hypothetical protein